MKHWHVVAQNRYLFVEVAVAILFVIHLLAWKHFLDGQAERVDALGNRITALQEKEMNRVNPQ
ncbi:MAG: hypothetical protein SFX74_03455 [Fimbriimonadaceae bacterium]|nr:hypothetical protein [Fimbriimonadaceae bacterium]